MGKLYKEPFLAGKVDDVMSIEPVTISQDAAIPDLVNLFREHHYHGVPVVDSNGRLAGVARDFEVLALFVSKEPFVTQYRTVRDIMHSPPLVIRSGETIQKAVQKMFANDTRFLVVVGSEHEILGVVTQVDLIRGIKWKDVEI